MDRQPDAMGGTGEARPEGVLFEETQRLQGWVSLLALAIFAASVASAALTRSSWSSLWPLAPVAILLVVTVGLVEMRTTVTARALEVYIRPFKRKSIAVADVGGYEAVVYRPLHYGGWGWRWSPTKGWAFTMRGNKGVRIQPRAGSSFLVGSQDPEGLVAALARAGQLDAPH